MRSILALSALVIFCASADAATVRHSRHVRQHARPEHAVTTPRRSQALCCTWLD